MSNNTVTLNALAPCFTMDPGKRLAHLREEGYLCSKGHSSATKYGLVDKLAARIRELNTSANSLLNGENSLLNAGDNGDDKTAKKYINNELSTHRKSSKNRKSRDDASRNSLLNAGDSGDDKTVQKYINDELSTYSKSPKSRKSGDDASRNSLLSAEGNSLLNAMESDNLKVVHIMQELGLPEVLRQAVIE